MGKVINGVLLDEFKRGWWGDNNEGETLLSQLELPNEIPFNVESYLVDGVFKLHLPSGLVAEVSIKKQDAYYEFACKYPNKRYCFKLFREWDGVELDTIIKIESYAIGECTRKVLTSRNFLQ